MFARIYTSTSSSPCTYTGTKVPTLASACAHRPLVPQSGHFPKRGKSTSAFPQVPRVVCICTIVSTTAVKGARALVNRGKVPAAGRCIYIRCVCIWLQSHSALSLRRLLKRDARVRVYSSVSLFLAARPACSCIYTYMHLTRRAERRRAASSHQGEISTRGFRT